MLRDIQEFDEVAIPRQKLMKLYMTVEFMNSTEKFNLGLAMTEKGIKIKGKEIIIHEEEGMKKEARQAVIGNQLSTMRGSHQRIALQDMIQNSAERKIAFERKQADKLLEEAIREVFTRNAKLTPKLDKRYLLV